MADMVKAPFYITLPKSIRENSLFEGYYDIALLHPYNDVPYGIRMNE